MLTTSKRRHWSHKVVLPEYYIKTELVSNFNYDGINELVDKIKHLSTSEIKQNLNTPYFDIDIRIEHGSIKLFVILTLSSFIYLLERYSDIKQNANLMRKDISQCLDIFKKNTKKVLASKNFTTISEQKRYGLSMKYFMLRAKYENGTINEKKIQRSK